MRTNLEVFGTNEVTPIPPELIEERLMLLKRKMAELTLVHYMNQDIQAINQCRKDMDFWIAIKEGEEDGYSENVV